MSSNYRVVTYEAHNVGGVKDVKFDLEGHHLFLVGGKNAQGKTSALNAIRMALCGKNGCDYPEVPLRDGEREGWVRAELASDLEDAGLAVELKFSRKRNGQVVEKFRIVDGTGADVPSPRTLLQRLFSLRAFDPLAFERLSRKEKRETLLRLAGVDIAEYKKRHDELYAERTRRGREEKSIAAVLASMEPQHPDVPDEEVSIQSLIHEQNRRTEHNRRNDRERQRLKEAREKEDRVRESVKSIEDEIARLQEKLATAIGALNQAELAVDIQSETVDVLEDADMAEIAQQLGSADAVNRKVRANVARKQKEAELQSVTDELERINAALDAVAVEQAQALEAAKWPVNGLAFDDDGVLFRGIPIEQCSKSERTIVSTRIGMALNPRLRLLVSEGGGDMDEETLRTLDGILKEEGFQLVLEMVCRGAEDEQRCAVVIEDGRVKEG